MDPVKPVFIRLTAESWDGKEPVAIAAKTVPVHPGHLVAARYLAEMKLEELIRDITYHFQEGKQ